MRFNVKNLVLIFISIWFTIHSTALTETADKILAIVDDDVITQSEIEQVITPLREEFKDKLSEEELTAKLSDARAHALNRMIEDKLLLHAAKKSGITVRNDEVNEKIKEVRNSFASTEEFEMALERQGYSLAALEKRYREQILTGKFVRLEIGAGITVTPAEAVDYYKQHPDEFNAPEEIKVKQIVLRKKEGEDADDKIQQSLKEITSLLEEGNNFDEVKARFSEGKDPGWVKRGELSGEIEDVIFNLAPGAHSAPLQVGSTFRIFKVEEKHDARRLEFSEAQSKIESILRTKKFEEKVKSWIGKEKETAYISVK
ncbi:MAG: SurA N-terminal domain-containing protein [Candidatus Omnitrophica bacterium]|nr:SurA N-terminal domain-containing protein [Candidatus Omnitrophota bacterium]